MTQKNAIKTFEKLVSMGLSEDMFWWVVKLQLNEDMYILALCSRLQKLTLFLKWKPNDIWTNVYNTHGGPLCEANIVVASYCTSFLTEVDKSITQEM